MIKKMRYYARFIIVCLLLNKDGNVRQFIGELEGLIEEYTKNFKPPDAKEWQMVLDEISTFTEAEKKIVPINLDRTSDKITHRLSSAVKERDLGPGIQKLKLQEAILVGNYQKQIKFSELTLDMYRMLQSLEREPFASHPLAKSNESSHQNEKKDANVPGAKEDQQQSQQQTTTTRSTATQITTSGAAGQVNQSERFGKRSNPHKYLLYRPSLSQLMVYISTAFKDTSDGCALLLYLSADGCAYPDQTVPGYGHGVVTTQRNKPNPNTDRTTTANAVAASTAAAISATAASGTGTQALTVATEVPVTPSVHCLCPGDLIPFTRKPLFLIVDSDHSTGFKNIPNVFDQPVMCLMSPTEYPSSVQDKSEIGSLFTLFLHTPLLGFCSVSDIGNLDQDDWDQCVKKIADMETMIGDMLIADPAFGKYHNLIHVHYFLYLLFFQILA
jgi:hypothetical protein